MKLFNLFRFLIETNDHTPSLKEEYLTEIFPNEVIGFLLTLTVLSVIIIILLLITIKYLKKLINKRE